MKNVLVFALCLGFALSSAAQEWSGISIPAPAGSGKVWELQSGPSDDFNYVFGATSQISNFGNGKWYNFYHNGWDGPGTTYWQYNHVSVDGDDLVLRASRNPSTTKMGVPGVNAGCITSNNRVLYPVYVEASVSVADITLASDVWLLSPDDTQEIDIIECYGGDENGNAFFAEFIHLSHHSFVRNPFTDYQPRDLNSWWARDGVTSWGDFCWNGGNRNYVRIGVNWISPVHFEYYIDGELVRVLYDKAFATKIGNTWHYTYPSMTNGQLDFDASGYQTANPYSTSAQYSFQTLQAASNVSNTSVIDPYNFQGGAGFNKELDIIINVESQDWHVAAGRTPTDAELNDPSKNKMLVDWIRVYKPVNDPGNVAVTGVTLSPSTLGLEVGQTGNLTGAVIPSNATDQTMTFSSNNTAVATVTQSGVVTAIAAGSATITATTTDGGYTANSTVTVTTSPPPGGNEVVIEAEQFAATGGTWDDSPYGGPGFGVNPSGIKINYVNAADWASYNFSIPEDGEYQIDYQISTPSANAQISISIDGQAVSVDNVPNNGAWDNYQTLTAAGTSMLTTGAHTAQITASGSNTWQWNLEKITLTRIGDLPGNPGGATIVIEAEDFTGTGGTIDDAPYGGPGLGVNDAGTVINYVNSSDWADYTINVGTSGSYSITYQISTPSNNAQVQLLVDGVLASTTNVPNNGQWDNYSALSGGSVSLSTGVHTVRLVASGSNAWQWNLDKVTLVTGTGARTVAQKVRRSEGPVLPLVVFPNPASAAVQLTGISAGEYQLQIIDLSGAVLMDQRIAYRPGYQLKLDFLNKGIYMIRMKGDASNHQVRLSVQ